eukprot:m.238138 g.238138  ORF g.238138 m.238138 type:complete len:91 (-) comp17425_c0_seq3:8-280(-)
MFVKRWHDETAFRRCQGAVQAYNMLARAAATPKEPLLPTGSGVKLDEFKVGVEYRLGWFGGQLMTNLELLFRDQSPTVWESIRQVHPRET